MSIADKLTTIAENTQKVYDAGKQAEYDAFWDAFQDSGNRTNYLFAFAGTSWNSETFKPKYDLKPARADYMFASNVGLQNLDLAELLNDAGVVLDTSQCTNFQYMFRYESVTRIPEIDTRSASSLNTTFVNCQIKTIDKLILKDDGSQIVQSMFVSTNQIENIVIEGVIGQNFSLVGCGKLTHDSLMSIIDALMDHSGTDETRTLTLHANSKALLSDEEMAIATGKGWTLA